MMLLTEALWLGKFWRPPGLENFFASASLSRPALAGLRHYEGFFPGSLHPVSGDGRERLAAISIEARNGLGNLLACDPGMIALSRGGTDALWTTLLSLRLRPHDEVVVNSHEYHGLFKILRFMTNRNYIRLRVVDAFTGTPSSDELTERYKAMVTSNTKLIIWACRDGRTGNLNALGDLIPFCNNRGIFTVIDASHSIGRDCMQRLESKPTAIVASLAKFLGCPAGTGFSAVFDSNAFDNIWDEPSGISNVGGQHFPSFGTSSLEPFAYIAPTISHHLSNVDVIEREIIEKQSLTAAQLKIRGITVSSVPGSGFCVAYMSPAKAIRASEALYHHGISVTILDAPPHDYPAATGLRVAVDPGTTADEIDNLGKTFILALPDVLG